VLSVSALELGDWGPSVEGIDSKSALATEPFVRTSDCVFVCARLLSKAITAICDDKLRSFGISSTQFALLSEICSKPTTRAQIARHQHLNRSTITRDLEAILSAGWIQEVQAGANGRTKPVALTRVGEELMLNAQQAWLAAQVQAEALLGPDGMSTLISITDRINP
jgi:DNA-binding MarR family transcriptional regulator